MQKQLTHSLRLLLFMVLIMVLMMPLATGADAHSQHAPIDIPANLEALYEADALIIQFAPHTKMRLRQGTPMDQESQVSAADINALYALSANGAWRRAHTLNENKLDDLWQRARVNTGQNLADPNNRFHLRLPADADMVAVAQQFNQLSVVEAVYFVPKPAPSTSTIDYSQAGNATGNAVTDPYQGYLDPAPNGVDARWSWLGMGGRGDGMRICDVEYDYNANHADLPNITYVGAPKDPPFGPDHGTAVLGEMGAENNGVGVKGIAYQALYYFAAAKTTTGGYDVGAAVLECADALDPGDVILIEQQFSGPNATGVGQAGLVPVEWFKPWYDDIKIAVAAGMIVVEAAGNGGENLDDPVYSTGNNGHFPFLPQNDSGAFIVGSANPPSFGATARARRPSSNYGGTVDLQGWGTGIVTTGYGNLFPGGTTPDASQENQWYTAGFGGTSGASPMVAASAAIVQRTWELTHGGTPASPAQIKQILRDTGTPQNGGDNIGPFPNLRAAILNVLGNQALAVSPPTITPGSGNYPMPLQAQIGYGAGQSGDNTNIRYTLNGSEPTADSFIFIPEQGDSLYLNYGVTLKAKAFQFHAPTQRVYESESAVVTYVSSTPKVETPVISPGAGTYNQPHQVTITTNTPGATIRYRTDGRAISYFYPGTLYSGPLSLADGEYEITARAYKDGYYKSDAAFSGDVIVNAIVLPMPVVYPDGGSFNGQVTVYIGSTVLGADIHYTLDGSTPTQSSPQFTEPIVLTESTTLKTRVFLTGYTPSNVVEKVFTVTQQAQGPTIDPTGGEFTDAVAVTMAAPDAGATIRYTTNGAEPTSYSSVYAGPFTLNVGEQTVKAKAFIPGALPSETTTAQFTVYSPVVGKAERPIFNPGGGNHTESVTVRLRTDTEGATIRYTFDPLSDENTWTTYAGPFTLTANPDGYVIRAKAYKSGMADSEPAQTSFNVFEPVGTIEIPDITPPSGTYDDVVQVTVDGHTEPPFKVRQLHITTDGAEPMPNANTGNGQSSPRTLTINTSTTVKAVAAQLGWYNSDIVTRDYTLQCATPEIAMSDAPPNAKTVTITSNTPGATIRYTLDGSAVMGASPEYNAPFAIGVGATVINAQCFRSGFEDSAVATKVGLVEEQVAPSIEQQPQDMTVDAGTDISFTVQVVGVPLPTIQWQFNGIDLAGETDPVLDVPSVQSIYAGTYRAVAANAAGIVTSSVASLVVNGAPVSGLRIDTSSPTPLGNPMYFSARIETGSDLDYVWDFGDGTTAAATMNSRASISHTYTLQGTYTVSVTVSNNINSQTESVTVQVVEPLPTPTPNPAVTADPSVTASPSATPDASVTPGGTPSPNPSGTPVAGSTPTPAATAIPTAGTNNDTQTFLPLVNNP